MHEGRGKFAFRLIIEINARLSIKKTTTTTILNIIFNRNKKFINKIIKKDLI